MHCHANPLARTSLARAHRGDTRYRECRHYLRGDLGRNVGNVAAWGLPLSNQAVELFTLGSHGLVYVECGTLAAPIYEGQALAFSVGDKGHTGLVVGNAER